MSKVKGLNNALSNLNGEISKIKGATIAGLYAGGLIIQEGAQRRVPVEYGNLRGSAYTRKSQKNKNSVEVGFGAAYALYVHENLEAKWAGKPRKSGKGVYWGPNGEPQFLLKSVRDNSKRVVEVVKSYAKVK